MTNTAEGTVPPKILRAVALCLLGLLSVFTPRGAAQGIITTVAGGGGLSSGPAASVLLPHPVGVATDNLGNLFVVSNATATVYKVDSSGNLTVVAGNGLQSGGANGIQATSSSLNGPVGIAIDPAGNLIIADQGPSVVRRVDHSTGIMTIIAGSLFQDGFSGDNGPAINALLNRPGGVAVDSAGNIFIGDAQNFRVRRIDAGTGTITTYAGNGTAGFSGDNGPATSASLAFGGTFNPASIAVDSAGNLFIADSQNNRIRRVDAGTHVISTVAGNGSGSGGDGNPATNAGLSFPLGVAVDGSGNLFIADFGGQRIREVNAATQLISTIAGNGTLGFSGDGGPATSAALSLPEGVTVDSAGNVFIADTVNNRTRKVDTSGKITTVAGNGSIGDGGPATSATLYFPNAVAVDGTGNFYIADTVNNVVRRVDAVTGVITHVAGVNDLCGFNGDSIPAASAQLCGPDGVAVDGSRNLFISDPFNNRIRRVDAVTGIITTVAGNGTSGFSGDNGLATSASLAMPSGVALDSAGNLFIDDANNNRIRRVDAVTGMITTVAGNGTSGFSGDTGLATDAALNLSSPFTGPGGLAVDGAGNLFFTDVGNARIRRVDAVTGIITTAAGSASSCNPGLLGDGGPATSASLCFPQGVAVDPTGLLYINDNGFLVGYQRVRRVDTKGMITTIAGGFGGFRGDGGLSTNAGFEFLRGIASFGANSLFVVDSNSLRIRQIALAPAPPPTTATSFTDASVTQTVSGGELILHKELSGFPNYGATDGAADILFTGQAATWHFPVSPVPAGASCAHFQVSVIADDHSGVPPSAYQLLAWADGKLDVTPPPTLPHGEPAASRFTNWVHINYSIPVVASPFTITLANASSGTGLGDFIAVDWIELHIPPSCAVPSSGINLVSAEFRGEEVFGLNTPTFSGPEPAATALDPVFGAADVWNALKLSFNPFNVDPSFSNLLDSTGAQTPVSFSITGTVGGVSLYAPAGTVSGFTNPDPLRSDFLVFNSNSTTIPGESTAIQWQITGLGPNSAYDMCVYGARADVARSFNMTIGGTTLNIPTLLFNDPSPSSCVLFRGIFSDASGTIFGVGMGIGSPVGFLNEANWAGFQIAPSSSISFSLSGNWSDTTNPSGPWSYNQGSNPLPLVADWTAADSAFVGCNQSAWAPSNSGGNFLPALMNANSCTANDLGTDPNSGLPNVLPDDIVTHTVDPFNGNPANGVANFLFTLPSGDDGSYEVRGSVWDAGLLFGTTRPQDWKLLVNGVEMASGVLSGIVSRSQAETFDVFASLAAGDTVELQLFEDPSAAAGFFVGTNMSITSTTAQTVTTPPQPVAPGTSTTFTNANIINQTVVLPPDANMNGTVTMAVSFIQVAPAVFNASIAGGTNGNAFSGGKPVPAGTTCTPIAGAGGNCVITEDKCFDANGTAFALCPITAPTTPIQLTSSYKTLAPQTNPALLIASDGQSNYAVITTGFNPADPTISGGTKALNSDAVIGNLPGTLSTDTVAPTTTATTSPVAPNGANGWFTTSPVSVILTATDDTLVKQISYSATGAQPIALTTVAGASTLFQIANEGVTTISFQATDQAGNVESLKKLTVKIDTTPPSISLSTPPNGATYTLNQAVAASYTCSDPESSPAPSCTGPVPNSSNIDTASVGSKAFTVNSTDAAGLSSTQTDSYAVSYNICTLNNPTAGVKSGPVIPLKMYLCDAKGNDVSNSSVIVHATKLIQVSTQVSDTIVTAGSANPGNDFRFDSTLGPSGGYIFNLLANLPTGTYELFFTAGNDPSTTHFLTFQVK
jgi:sugar lactone lactonase YvrE